MVVMMLDKILKIEQPEGSRNTDDTFSSGNYGTFNIGLIRRRLLSGQLKASMNKIAITDSVIIGNAECDVNDERLKSMTYNSIINTFCTVPMIMLDCEDGYHILIDGTHRLRWMIQNHYESFPAIIVKLSDIRPYMMRFLESVDNGKSWQEIDHETIARMGYGKFPQHQPDNLERFEKAKMEK